MFPGLALLLAVAAGYLLWTDGSTDGVALARTESVRVASEDAVALLSYKAESADKDLNAARDRLTGDFKDAYTDLIRRVVIPGAKEKQISAGRQSECGSVGFGNRQPCGGAVVRQPNRDHR